MKRQRQIGALVLLTSVLLTACGMMEAQTERVPPALEAISLERDNDLHTLSINAEGGYFDFMLVGGDLYISQEKTIEQIPLAEPENRQVVLTLAQGQFGQFLAIGQERYLDSTNGGSDISARYHLRSAGQWEQLPEAGAFYVKNQLLAVSETPYEEGGNLYSLTGDAQEKIGDERYHYYPPVGDEDIGLIKDGVLLAGYVPGEEAHHLLCKVALPGGETTVLAKYHSSMVIDQNDIYVRQTLEEADTSVLLAVLEKIPAAGGEAQRISLPNPYAANYGQFTVLDGRFYYQDNAYTPRPMIAGAVPQDYYDQVMDEWQQSISGTHELYRLGDAESLNPGAPLRQLGRTDRYVYALFEPQNDRVKQNYPCLMVFDQTGQTVYQTPEVVKAVSICGDLLSFTVDEIYSPESQGKVYWTWLGAGE